MLQSEEQNNIEGGNFFDQNRPDSINRNKTDHVPSSGIDKYDALKKQFASADPDGEGDLGSMLLAE